MKVSVTDLVCRFGAFTAVDGISFHIGSGQCLALLGPSGCGKTTTLNAVAGFIEPAQGDICVGDHSILGVSPHRRNTGMVFQNYALFPHMSVFDNVAYALRRRKVDEGRIRKDVEGILSMVHLDGLGDRYPRELSGGQQQRVALARALVFGPDVLLLDEPLSNLDAKLRDAMRLELKEIRQRTGVTTILVTHDQSEAMTLADQIAVMHKGRIEQVGTAADIYDRPTTRFVADFVGAANFLTGTVTDQSGPHLSIRIPGLPNPVLVARGDASPEPGGVQEFFVRPERLRMSDAYTGGVNEIPATVRNVVFTGPSVDCFCDFGDIQLHTRLTTVPVGLETGRQVFLSWEPDAARAVRAD
jgi:ABC-type Fe3+/spermidine/putrescine transport system ATPase subunit